jgi:hypothetical protein
MYRCRYVIRKEKNKQNKIKQKKMGGWVVTYKSNSNTWD